MLDINNFDRTTFENVGIVFEYIDEFYNMQITFKCVNRNVQWKN